MKEWCLNGALREVRPTHRGMWLEETTWNTLTLTLETNKMAQEFGSISLSISK